MSNNSIFPLQYAREYRDFETKTFAENESKNYLDEAFGWLENGCRVALLHPNTGPKFVLLPIEVYEGMENIANADSYLPHWELDQIVIEDYPTVKDLLIGAKDDLLEACVREVLSSALFPSENPDLSGACDYIRRMTDVVRGFKAESCDRSPVIMLPCRRYHYEDKTDRIECEIQVIAVPIADASTGNVARVATRYLGWWGYTLGFKAWFGSVSIRDEYRALAWLLCKMHASGLVKYGIWMGELPARVYTHPEVRRLNEAAVVKLSQCAQDAARRVCKPEDLDTLTFECPEEDLNQFKAACMKLGLSVQNGAYIALRRLIAEFQHDTAQRSKGAAAK